MAETPIDGGVPTGREPHGLADRRPAPSRASPIDWSRPLVGSTGAIQASALFRWPGDTRHVAGRSSPRKPQKRSLTRTTSQDESTLATPKARIRSGGNSDRRHPPVLPNSPPYAPIGCKNQTRRQATHRTRVGITWRRVGRLAHEVNASRSRSLQGNQRKRPKRRPRAGEPRTSATRRRGVVPSS